MNSVKPREHVEDLSEVDDLALYLEGRREAIRRNLHGPHPYFSEVHPYCRPQRVELHVTDYETTFPKKFGKKTKEAGGHYSHLWGHSDTRYVNLSLIGNEELIRQILDVYQTSTLIWKGGGMINRMMAWAVVCSFHRDKHLKEADDKLDACIQQYIQSYQESLERNIINPAKEELETIRKALEEQNSLNSESNLFKALDSLSADSTLQDIVSLARWSREMGRSAALVDALAELDTETR